MSSTQYYVAQSLDGYIAELDGGLDWLLRYGASEAEVAEATEGAYERFFAQVGAVAMGSATYEFLLAEGLERWPYEGMASWVFSSREPAVPWEGADIRFARGPVEPVHEQLRAAAGDRNVWVVGGGNLASQFVEAGLLDGLLVTIVPVWLGDGLPTFARRLDGRLRLTGASPFPNGMTELRYDVLR